MKNRPFFWHILPSFLLLTGIICFGILFFANSEFRKFNINQTKKELIKQTILIRKGIVDILNNTPDSLGNYIGKLGNETKTRFTVINCNGEVLADSENDHHKMDNHRDRPEILMAIKENTGTSVRYSETLKRSLMYVAMSSRMENEKQIVIRLALPLVSIIEKGSSFYNKLILFAISILFLTIILSIIISRKLSTPLEELRIVSEKIADGDFKHTPIPTDNVQEITKLSIAMRTMSEQLSYRIEKILRQENEEKSILKSMVEGVIAIDTNQHIIMINDAAFKMLSIENEDVKGKLISEILRNSVLISILQNILLEKTTILKEIIIQGNQKIIVELQGRVLKGIKDGTIDGVLVVMHDVTHLKNLEKVRQDFVANVSHELRTPLTSIKGFVETLMEDTDNKKEDRKHFLTIINNHVNRLNNLIEDLLTISRLEKDDINAEIDFNSMELDSVIDYAISVCTQKAKKKKINIIVKNTNGIKAIINNALFEQALINLIDNAIKYSEENTTITIKAKKVNNSLILSVSDQGYGIENKHIPRLFERFYRIDKARSRKIGGTGLGLSIVKHIINVHNGKITVESNKNQGTTFIITIPDHKNGEINNG